ncbi:hypothetical protein GRI62_09985 [Erythrobacter arachoides]|uniref:DUF5681 domain-containing protein n=1 Tax=Aurantiacibacter arachoides TaxID=1850444 RepID=A0A845A8P2_9SPHN|nr:DUF5681 domain-containing protein [Aurantiacibacter arachoides]MXO93929.1 hypothetical protein [Aurantiacibacter arachoides]GGD45537.1 hypothetical protein GCM10011411_01390 [Aurantiacibacter arachoides]
MSGAGDGRFVKGRSGNPAGRPKARRPNVSAFDIIFDKTLTVTQGGRQRELSIDEALELQTYHAALKGSRMAIRKVLKMIEKREKALAKANTAPVNPITIRAQYSSGNANEALRLLGIAEPDPGFATRIKVNAWATQAALRRPGRAKFSPKDVADIKFFTFDAERLRWPRGRNA